MINYNKKIAIGLSGISYNEKYLHSVHKECKIDFIKSIKNYDK